MALWVCDGKTQPRCKPTQFTISIPLWLMRLLREVLLPRGVTWHYARPPVVDLEYEMDCRGVQIERVFRPAQRARSKVPYGSRSVAVFLAGSDSDCILAQSLNVDGGNWMNWCFKCRRSIRFALSARR